MGDGIQNKYLLIINGDTEVRHVNNVENAISEFKKEAKRKTEIYVTSPVQPKQTVDEYTEPTSASLKQLIANISKKIDDDDHLVVYVTGHGSEDDGKGGIVLPDGHFLLETLEQELDQLSFGSRIMIMDQCYSGDGMILLAGEKTTVVTAGSPGETVSCELFANPFWNNQNSDSNHDGIITIQERFAASSSNSQKSFIQSFFSPLPSEISLSGKIAKKRSFKPKVVSVYNKDDFKNQLNKLKPGQLALVTFSADWCVPCQEYKQKFDALAKEYDGKFLMIRLEGINRSEENWAEEYEISSLPTVAFINWEGHIAIVKDRNNPIASLVDASILDKDEQIKLIIKRLASPDFQIKLGAIMALNKMDMPPPKEAIPYLIQCLDDNNCFYIRNQAALCLKKIGPDAKEAVPSLIKRLKHPDEGIGPDSYINKKGQIIIVRVDDVTSTDVALSAMNALMKIDPESTEVIQVLTEVLEDKDQKVRIQAALELANKKPNAKEAVPILVESLDDPDRGLRMSAASALAKIGPSANEAIPALIQALQDSEPGVRMNAALALGNLKAKEAIPHLIAGFKDEKVQNNANSSIVKIGSEAIPALTVALNDADSNVRTWAALTLTEINPIEAIPPLIDVLGDTDKDVRNKAKNLLEDMGLKAAPELVKALENDDLNVRTGAAITLATIDPDNKKPISALIEATKSTDTITRMESTWALGRLEAKEAVPVLIEALKDTEHYVRKNAAWSLGEIGPKAKNAIPALIEASHDEDPDVRTEAQRAIKAINGD